MKPKVAFVCVHNSCRSQMAEAVSKLYAKDFFDAYSAGTHTKPEINQDANRIVKNRLDVDMNATQYSKTLDAIPEVDIVITMGCNVECPFVPSRHQEDWGLDDPSGLSDVEFERTLSLIMEKVMDLKQRIEDDII